MPNYSTKPRSVVTINAKLGYDNIPWEHARTAYLESAAIAESTALAAHEDEYATHLDKLHADYDGGESGAYEGNFSDSEVMPSLSPTKLLQLRDKAGQAGLIERFVTAYGLIDHVHLFMPQVITTLASMTLKRSDNGLISGLRFRNENFNTDKLKGLYRFLMMDSRSSYLKQQYTGTNRNYCALVPLVMYAHKLVHRVPYSAWDPAEVEYVVNKQLADAMTCKPGVIPNAALLDSRAEGLKIRSGAHAGTSNNPVWKHRLAGPQLKTGVLKDVPYLGQVMLTQIWCAHPDNRTNFMILDPNNWDRVPIPLVTVEVLSDPKPEKPSFTKSHAIDIPWDT